MREWIISNKVKYRVLNIEVRNFQELKHGIIDRILQKQQLPEFHFMTYTEYILTVKSKFEAFTRKFFLSEKDYSKIDFNQ